MAADRSDWSVEGRHGRRNLLLALPPRRPAPLPLLAVIAVRCVISLVVVLSVGTAAAAAPRNVVTRLPGFQGTLPFHLETGYVEVDKEHGVQLFYYFIESERSPVEDPVMLWITGGPGCSAFSGLMFEIGPMKFDVAGYTEGLPSMSYFPDSWTQVSNIIFLDTPVGTGFSYATTEAGYVTNDTKSAQLLVAFLRKWYEEHPEFIPNALYLGGDSYSGITIPVSCAEIARANKAKDGLFLNLKGYIVGNGGTDPFYDGQGRVPFLHGMALISNELYESAEEKCDGNYVTPKSEECSDILQTINERVAGVNPAQILEPFCGFASRRNYIPAPASIRAMLERTDEFLLLNQHLDLPVECRDSGYKLSYLWADDSSVREVLGIHQGSIGSWSRCTSLVHFTNNEKSVIGYHMNLTTSGYRALIYNGDHDMGVPYISTQAWIKSMNFAIIEDWRAWNANLQVAGFTRTFLNNLTYATVKGGGHTAPEYRPKECLAMVGRWLSGLPL